MRICLIAFNLTDVSALAGTVALVVAIGIRSIRDRELIPPPDGVQASSG